MPEFHGICTTVAEIRDNTKPTQRALASIQCCVPVMEGQKCSTSVASSIKIVADGRWCGFVTASEGVSANLQPGPLADDTHDHHLSKVVLFGLWWFLFAL